MNYLLSVIGYWGPSILLFTTAYGIMLYNKTFMNYYIVFYFVGLIINCLLKLAIRQPRPTNQKHLYDFEKASNNELKKISGQIFGMPSGHAQTCFYSLFTTIFVVKNALFVTSTIIITCISCWQRYAYRNHTLLQLLVGSLVGIMCFGLANYVYSSMLTS